MVISKMDQNEYPASSGIGIRVAGYQMEVTDDVRRNANLIKDAIKRAGAENADILLTPEGSLSGYKPIFDVNEVGQYLGELTSLAAEFRVGLALGTCFQEADGLIYNQLRFYASDGNYLGFHSKILLCGSMTNPDEGEVNHYATSELKVFRYKNIVIGGLICNDMWANPGCTPMPDPHLSQQLARMGAQIIFHAVNGGRNGSEWSREVIWPFHETNLRKRAAAGNIWIVTVDSCTPITFPCASASGVVDRQGNWACRTESQGEQFFVHTIDLSSQHHNRCANQ